jgi:hypothetical protein
MINKFLSRLPKEDHIAYWIPQENVKSNPNEQEYPKPKYREDEQEGLFLGEQFFFAFETDEFTELQEVMGQQYIDNSLPMEISTSSTLEFKVGDKIVFYDRIKLITAVGVMFMQDDITIGVGFNPNIKRYYTRLTLS